MLTTSPSPQVTHYQRHGNQVCGSDGKLPGSQHPFRLEEHLLSVSPGSLRPWWDHSGASLPDHWAHCQWVWVQPLGHHFSSDDNTKWQRLCSVNLLSWQWDRFPFWPQSCCSCMYEERFMTANQRLVHFYFLTVFSPFHHSSISEHLPGALCSCYWFVPGCSEVSVRVCVQRSFSWHQHGGYQTHTALR